MSYMPIDNVATLLEHLREKFHERFLLAPDVPIDVYPAALMFRKVAGHCEALRKSLRTHGQLTDATIFVIDERAYLGDGNTRRKLLAEDGKRLRCRFVDVAELGDKTVEEWILENNLNGATARQLTDTQRALQAAEFEPKIRSAAEARIKSGKIAAIGEKGRTEEHLARIAGCKSSRIRQGLELKKVGDPRLIDAVWNGDIAISAGLRIAELPDESSRHAALAAAIARDKLKLSRLLCDRTLDGLRQPIPQTLISVFDEAASLDKACQHLDSALETLRAMTSPGIDLNRLRQFANALQDNKPYCVCPFCEGPAHDCLVCENNRWLTAARYETAKNEAFALRRRVK